MFPVYRRYFFIYVTHCFITRWVMKCTRRGRGLTKKLTGKQRVYTLFAVILLCAIPAWTMACTLYQYEDDPRFWWYISDANPAFEILVPSNTTGDAYPMYVHRNQFGDTGVDIYVNEKGSYLSVGYMKGGSSQVSAVRENM